MTKCVPHARDFAVLTDLLKVQSCEASHQQSKYQKQAWKWIFA